MNELLKSILDGIYGLVQNYGLSVVVFTIIIRLCLLPLDYKSRVGMRKISKLMPKQQALQKKYEKDPEKYQRKLAELYKKEKASPMSGCWPLLVSMPILFAMFAAMRMMADTQMVGQAFDILLHKQPTMEPFLWIKNLWMPDSPFNPAWPSADNLRAIVDQARWMDGIRALDLGELVEMSKLLGANLGAVTLPDLSTLQVVTDGANLSGMVLVNGQEFLALAGQIGGQIGVDASSLNIVDGSFVALAQSDYNTMLSSIYHAFEPLFVNTSEFKALDTTIATIGEQMKSWDQYVVNTATRPSWTIPLINWTVHVNFNGLFLLPLMSAGSQYVMTKLNPSTNNQPATTKDGQQQPAAGGGFMKWFFPIFSLVLCANYNAAFALYWVTSNLIAMAQNVLINKYLDHKDALAEANPEPV